MSTSVVFDNLESVTGWQSVIGPSINKTQAESIGITQQVTKSDGAILRVTNTSTQTWGGGLAKFPIPVVDLSSAGIKLARARIDLEYRLREEDLALLGRLETDLKLCVAPAPSPTSPIPNIVDGSTQFNISEDWMLQIDKAGGGWIDTGHNFEPPMPDEWMPMSLGFSYDTSALTFSVTDVDTVLIADTFGNLPMLTTNWTRGAIQLQTEVLAPGVVEVAYRKIKLTLSTL
jgi:hypothetical protein